MPRLARVTSNGGRLILPSPSQGASGTSSASKEERRQLTASRISCKAHMRPGHIETPPPKGTRLRSSGEPRLNPPREKGSKDLAGAEGAALAAADLSAGSGDMSLAFSSRLLPLPPFCLCCLAPLSPKTSGREWNIIGARQTWSPALTLKVNIDFVRFPPATVSLCGTDSVALCWTRRTTSDADDSRSASRTQAESFGVGSPSAAAGGEEEGEEETPALTSSTTALRTSSSERENARVQKSAGAVLATAAQRILMLNLFVWSQLLPRLTGFSFAMYCVA